MSSILPGYIPRFLTFLKLTSNSLTQSGNIYLKREYFFLNTPSLAIQATGYYGLRDSKYFALKQFNSHAYLFFFFTRRSLRLACGPSVNKRIYSKDGYLVYLECFSFIKRKAVNKDGGKTTELQLHHQPLDGGLICPYKTTTEERGKSLIQSGLISSVTFAVSR